MTVKKLHPADLDDLQKVATATHFNVHLRRGPHFKINQEAPTLDAAIVVADRLAAEHDGKVPMIYAITPDNLSVFVPKAMIAAARKAAQAVIAPDLTASEQEILQAIDAPAPAKPAKAAKSIAPAKPASKRAAILEAAQRGEMPAAPDFSAETHKRFRPKLAEVVALADAGDLVALKAIEIKAVTSSPKAIAKYRDLAVIALEVRHQAAA